ncbi:response regulator [Flammeovirga aprica]|uniref:Response regulator n=1 Tax=Flammeovirga aprica JL-4 TaxID=694437 RepID=A0A7X9RTV0_9BACT|nr:response regulator [Flammeovirga aprica]NME68029.1 response regulator [Flammeovirga aprica JL-4]
MKFPILIIEDDQFMRDLTINALKDKYEVYAAQTLEEAKKVLKNKIIKLVLTDLNLDQENTFDFILNLRSSKHYSDIPIVVYSGQFDLTQKGHLLNKGVAGFIEKPLSLNELQIRIDNSIAHYSKVSRIKMNERKATPVVEEEKTSTIGEKVNIIRKSFYNTLFT